MPIILQFTYIDGSTEVIRIPADIWRRSEEKVSKVFILDKKVDGIRMDPFLETADTDLNNNAWPETRQPTRFDLYEQKRTRDNPMQRDKKVKALEGQ